MVVITVFQILSHICRTQTALFGRSAGRHVKAQSCVLFIRFGPNGREVTRPSVRALAILRFHRRSAPDYNSRDDGLD